MHELIARGAAAVRQRNGWTQEYAARMYRRHGLASWRTSTVGSLEAGLRRPRLDEVLLMCAALDVALADLVKAADEGGAEAVELGDGAVLSTRMVRGYLCGGFEEISGLSADDLKRTRWFPLHDKAEETVERALGKQERLNPALAPVAVWSRRHGVRLLPSDYGAAVHRTPSEADRHAARRLGTEPAVIRFAARALWHQDFDEERDSRVGDIDQIKPRSRQARRGIATREMLAEMKQMLTEARELPGADDSVHGKTIEWWFSAPEDDS